MALFGSEREKAKAALDETTKLLKQAGALTPAVQQNLALLTGLITEVQGEVKETADLIQALLAQAKDTPGKINALLEAVPIVVRDLDAKGNNLIGGVGALVAKLTDIAVRLRDGQVVEIVAEGVKLGAYPEQGTISGKLTVHLVPEKK